MDDKENILVTVVSVKSSLPSYYTKCIYGIVFPSKRSCICSRKSHFALATEISS